jgi:hypothetical protein
VVGYSQLRIALVSTDGDSDRVGRRKVRKKAVISFLKTITADVLEQVIR